MLKKIVEFVKKHKKAIVTIVGGMIVVTLAGIVIYKCKVSEVPGIEQAMDATEEAVEQVIV